MLQLKKAAPPLLAAKSAKMVGNLDHLEVDVNAEVSATVSDCGQEPQELALGVSYALQALLCTLSIHADQSAYSFGQHQIPNLLGLNIPLLRSHGPP